MGDFALRFALVYNVLLSVSVCEAVQVEPEEYWNFHMHTVHLDTIKVSKFVCLPTEAQLNCLKKQLLKFALKFTFKQLRHVSVQSHHHQGVHNSALPEDCSLLFMRLTIRHLRIVCNI